jgi:predicted SprT family Zn-dependent metalloprotease
MDIQSFTAAVNAKVAEVEQKAFSVFRFPIGMIKWQLNAHLKPFTAGRAYRSTMSFDLNPRYVDSHAPRLIDETTPHEIGHLICCKAYPYAKEFHGPEFRYVVRKLCYPDAARTYHDYKRGDDSAKRRVSRHLTICLTCGKQLELTAHKINKLHIYTHRGCGGKLAKLCP